MQLSVCCLTFRRVALQSAAGLALLSIKNNARIPTSHQKRLWSTMPQMSIFLKTNRLTSVFVSPQDPRFNAEVDLITGYKTQSILCLPIKNHRGEVRPAPASCSRSQREAAEELKDPKLLRSCSGKLHFWTSRFF